MDGNPRSCMYFNLLLGHQFKSKLVKLLERRAEWFTFRIKYIIHNGNSVIIIAVVMPQSA